MLVLLVLVTDNDNNVERYTLNQCHDPILHLQCPILKPRIFCCYCDIFTIVINFVLRCRLHCLIASRVVIVCSVYSAIMVLVSSLFGAEMIR